MEKSYEYTPIGYRFLGASFAAAALFSVVNSSVDAAPLRALCADPIESIAPYEYADLLPPITASEVLSDDTRDAYLQKIDDLFTVPVYFERLPAIETAEIASQTLNGIVDALETATPALLESLDLQSIAITQNIETQDDSSPSALYFIHQNKIIIEQSNDQLAQMNTFHEIVHAIDHKLLCPASDVGVDAIISNNDPADERLFATTAPGKYGIVEAFLPTRCCTTHRPRIWLAFSHKANRTSASTRDVTAWNQIAYRRQNTDAATQFA